MGFALLGSSGRKKIAGVDLGRGQGSARPAPGGRGPRTATFDAIDFGGMVAHRLYARDSFVEGLAKALRFLKLDGVNFGRIEDAGKLAQLARGVILLTGKLLRDLVKAVDDAPSDARRDGGKAGVGQQVENLTGDLGGNEPRDVGVGHVLGGWFVVEIGRAHV